MNPTLYFSTPNGSASQRRISFVSGRTWHDPTSWRKRRSASSWRLTICWHRPSRERISNPDSLVMFPMLVIQHPRCRMGFYQLWLWHRFTRNLPIWLSVKGEMRKKKKLHQNGEFKNTPAQSEFNISHLHPFLPHLSALAILPGTTFGTNLNGRSHRDDVGHDFHVIHVLPWGLPQAMVFSEPTFNFNLVDSPFCRWCFSSDMRMFPILPTENGHVQLPG